MKKVKVLKFKSLKNNYVILSYDFYWITLSLVFSIILILFIHINLKFKVFLTSFILVSMYFLFKQPFKGRIIIIWFFDLIKFSFREKKFSFMFYYLSIPYEEHK
jgi:hypothetical protein